MSLSNEFLPAGPLYCSDTIVVKAEEAGINYSLIVFPDFNNEAMKTGPQKKMHFYYMPDKVRLARTDNNDYQFSFLRFKGVLNKDYNMGIEQGQLEPGGGIVNFGVTLKVPEAVMQIAKQKIRTDKGISSDIAIELGQVPIIESEMEVNLDEIATSLPEIVKDDTGTSTALKVWGKGKNNCDANGVSAMSATMGVIPASIIEEGFKGATGNISVRNLVKAKFKVEPYKATLEGDYTAIYKHFSAALGGHYMFASADLKGAYNSAVEKGVIKRSVTMDPQFLKEADKAVYLARLDMVYDKFMKWIETTMMDKKPEPPKAAETKSGGIGKLWGVGFSFKAEVNTKQINLSYNEEIREAYIQENIIGGTLEGLFNEIKANVDAKDKYFREVFLGEAYQKVHIQATSRAFWPEEGVLGDPIDKIMIEVGYPDSKGKMVIKNSALYMPDSTGEITTNSTGKYVTKPAVWTKDNPNAIFLFDFPKISGPNADKILVKKHIYYKANPKVLITSKKIDIEELTDQHSIEVFADTLGTLRVGPITIDTTLVDNIDVLIIFKQGKRKEIMKFNTTNLEEERYFEVFMKSDTEDIPWSYQVEVVVKNKPLKPAIRWKGEEIKSVGNGPLVAVVPPVPKKYAAAVDELLAEMEEA
ncbi:hypothetical protein [Solitalea lacus]|uniref:hypothetical protein n=1 Tax=Solitalea lacus TaxID=2911172 RepID=UPI001EDC5F17|nr:hypothetical protein [Solitalea lacus]UKJ08519.1 hypothetical protein L2B55_04985 [Solitalea lacus]